jgi:C-terminal region of band_7
VNRFGELAKTGNTLVLPANLTDVGSMIALAMNVIRRPSEGRP